ncbi:YitT family protein [Herbivorax sp. ANBcel31]|uniref:YitT family protein n=1 Tax=Herbivorax sp. ANBcel31 TaxID=3069754 RepID=UPI0027B47904|nr:YitT family protein [Herbivorax sp. ANBcel31]MDQ2085422.1 YitT family protein [Herbivorax sp. ANBcel31]
MSIRDSFEKWKDYLWIIIGAFVAAAGINIFIVPYKIAPGGVSGIATVLYYLSGERFPVGATMLVFNIPLFILGIRFIGKKFALKTLFGTIFLSIIIDVTKPIGTYFVDTFLLTPEIRDHSPDILLYSMFGGLLLGIGLGLVFRSGATTGGTDLAARMVNQFTPALTIGQTLLFIDFSVILFAAVTFQSFQLALYAIVTLYISTKIIDAILEGVSFAKALFIISDMPEIIAPRIMKELDRGVTALKGTGMYTRNDKQVLLCVVHRGQLMTLKRIVNDTDEKAFIILTDIREVLGEGFKK